MPALVSALNRVDLPTFGKPTMPHFKLFLPEEGFQEAARLLRLRLLLGFLDRSFLFGRLFLLDRLRLSGMQFLRRALHVASDHLRQHLQRAVHRLVDRRLVLGRGLLQNVVGDRVLVAGMADADAQAPVVVRAEALRDVLQPVVAGDAAALLDARHAGREVELVVHHQHLFGLDLEEAGEHLHRAAAAVHEALRHQQERRVVAADQRLELPVLAQHDAVGRSEALHQPEAGVVPRALVLLARIAEPDDKANHFLSFFSPLSAAGFSAPFAAVALSPPLAAAPFSPSAGASPSFGAADCSVVGTSAAATAAAAVAASSSSVMSCGTTTVATTGSSPLCIESSTPFGSDSSRACSDLPTARLERSTSTNSGRSAGKQTMCSSFSTWLTTPPCSFTPGDFSALTKCSGTFMWIFLSLET